VWGRLFEGLDVLNHSMEDRDRCRPLHKLLKFNVHSSSFHFCPICGGHSHFTQRFEVSFPVGLHQISLYLNTMYVANWAIFTVQCWLLKTPGQVYKCQFMIPPITSQLHRSPPRGLSSLYAAFPPTVNPRCCHICRMFSSFPSKMFL